MLNLYTGRASVDQERAMYQEIRRQGGKAVVVVPDQYTLEGERQAMAYLETGVLLDVEITSMTRLGSKLLTEVGGNQLTYVDSYGRYMLLAQVARKVDSQLSVFRGMFRRETFLEAMNDLLTDLKQHAVSPETLSALAEAEPEGVLRRKLLDLALLFGAYEERMGDKLTDAEDYMARYTEAIGRSTWAEGRSFWFYGFDSLAQRQIQVICALAGRAPSVGVTLLYDQDCRDAELFALPGRIMNQLRQEAQAAGIPCQVIPQGPVALGDVPQESVGNQTAPAPLTGQPPAALPPAQRPPAVRAIERELFAEPPKACMDHTGLTVVQCANLYNEAESAAAFVRYLTREKGYHYRDIVVISNDQEVRMPIISRIFQEYGIDLFQDTTRPILSAPLAVFVVALADACAKGLPTAGVLKVLKTGFTPLSAEEIEELENYAIQYRIQGSRWRSPFTRYLSDAESETACQERLAHIEGLRQRAMALFTGYEAVCLGKETAPPVDTADYVKRYYTFLTGPVVDLETRIQSLMEEQIAAGLPDKAEETAQIWSSILGALDQIVVLIGDEPFHRQGFVEMLTAGLSQMEVGVLPPTVDSAILGNMQRTRSGKVRALLVLGMNEGSIPIAPTDKPLFSEEEMARITARGQLLKDDAYRRMEEELAIYRNLSRPTDCLWISYTMSDGTGEELRPSPILDRLHEIFPTLEDEPDVLNRGDMTASLGGQVNTLRHYTQALQAARKGEALDCRWEAVEKWLSETDPAGLARIRAGLAFANRQEPLPEELASRLYGEQQKNAFRLSPSRVERFSRCPFSHFVQYGLRPQERRIYQAASRELGDLYHLTLMEVSSRLTEEDRWESVTEAECQDMIREILQREGTAYRDGLFQSGGEERYKLDRIAEACLPVCLAMIDQVRTGTIQQSLYEESFGRGKGIPAIEKDLPGGKVYIEGKIDRVDVLSSGRVKIIDYKTGKESFSVEEARAGYRLQLMLYLKAAQAQVRRPAGVFYFLITDVEEDVTGMDPEKISAEISKKKKKNFRLDGIMVNDVSVLQEIAGDFQEESDVVKVGKKKDGSLTARSASTLLEEGEFQSLQEDIDQVVDALCQDLITGRIDIRPKKSRDGETHCKWCPYKGICRFDTRFAGCRYETI